MNNMCFVAQLIRALCWNHESTCSDPAEEEATKIFRHVLNAGFLIGASCLRDLRFRYFIVNEEIKFPMEECDREPRLQMPRSKWLASTGVGLDMRTGGHKKNGPRE
ncbi:hypothetical protein HUJ05_006676 [Dendroctonus ponderosae]|nr:hypothetical protein HUJ05_006676 [Dendroctonus ponderosae]